MNRETRDKLAKGTDQQNVTGGNACWETAPAIYDKLNADFGPFDIDLFADETNHKAPTWFGPGSPVFATDALAIAWYAFGQRGFGNPPYGRFIQRVLAYAKEQACYGFEPTLLLPLRITKAFMAHVVRQDVTGVQTEVWLPDKRLVFFENGAPRISFGKKGKPRPDTALFDSVIVRFMAGFGPATLNAWSVPKHVTKQDVERAVARFERLEDAA